MVGMNPGPFGMAQTGVPFGDVTMVRDFLGIQGPRREAAGRAHPRRPVAGFDCHRSEVSGARFWGWARDRFGTAETVLRARLRRELVPARVHGRVGRNRPPDKLTATEASRCSGSATPPSPDRRDAPSLARGRHPSGFAEQRAREALGGDVKSRTDPAPEPRQPGREQRLAGGRRRAAARAQLRADVARSVASDDAPSSSVELMLLTVIRQQAIAARRVTRLHLEHQLGPAVLAPRPVRARRRSSSR